jgi:hypothetical protein
MIDVRVGDQDRVDGAGSTCAPRQERVEQDARSA